MRAPGKLAVGCRCLLRDLEKVENGRVMTGRLKAYILRM